MSFSKPSFFGSSVGGGPSNLMTGILGSSTSSSTQRAPFGTMGNLGGSNTSPLFGGGSSTNTGLGGILGNTTTGSTGLFSGGGGAGIFGSGGQATGGISAGVGIGVGGGLFGGASGLLTVGSASSTPQVSPGTQAEEFKVQTNKDNYEVYCYNFSDKMNCYSLKMLRLQDYMNFKNNQIMDRHKSDVARYFQQFKNHKMAPSSQTNAIGSGIIGAGLGGQSSNIFAAGQTGMTGISAGIMGGGSGGIASGGGLANIFGQSQPQNLGSGMNVFGQQTQGSQIGGNIFNQGTSNSTQVGNIFNQGNQLHMSAGLGGATGGGFNNIFGGGQQNNGQAQAINAFGHPVVGAGTGGVFGGNPQQSSIGNLFNSQGGNQLGSLNQQLAMNNHNVSQVVLTLHRPDMGILDQVEIIKVYNMVFRM